MLSTSRSGRCLAWLESDLDQDEVLFPPSRDTCTIRRAQRAHRSDQIRDLRFEQGVLSGFDLPARRDARADASTSIPDGMHRGRVIHHAESRFDKWAAVPA